MLDKRNDALNLNGNTVNGRTAQIAITTHGSDWYWAVCAVMTVATIAFVILGQMKPRSDRVFHYITAAITMVAAIAYFSMGSNLGFTPIPVEFHRSDPKVRGENREIFYVRYIDWFITTPLLLLDLLLTAGMPWPTILWTILVDWVMIVTGLVGALVQSDYKWGYFAFGCAALLYIAYQLVWEARRHAAALGDDVGRAFLGCGTLTLVLWFLYPVAWGVCEGGNVIAPDSEAVFYGVLDLLAKPVFGALLIFGHRNIDPARLGLLIRDYDSDSIINRGLQHEKHTHGGLAAGVATGAAAEHHHNNHGVTNGNTHTGVTNTTGTTDHHTAGTVGGGPYTTATPTTAGGTGPTTGTATETPLNTV